VSDRERRAKSAGKAQKDEASLVRHEEELELDTRTYESGSVRARKRVETEPVERVEPRSVEQADFERAPARAGDSGEIETLADGSVSIPLFEERLAVTKQLFVRERVIVRKRTVTEHERIRAELRKEHIEVEGPSGSGKASSHGRPATKHPSQRQSSATRATDEPTRDELYAQAQRLGIEGRSKMNKRQLAREVEGRRGGTKRKPAGAETNPSDVQT